MEIPKLAQDRPIYKGLLVPYTVKWYDGKPDFKVTNPMAVKRCVLDRKCGLCGNRLGTFMWFIGGPMSIANKLFTDPAMHRECAEYSMTVCPFLSGQITEMAKNYKEGQLTTTVDPKRPDRFGLLETDGCHFITYRGSLHIRANSGIVKWWPYSES